MVEPGLEWAVEAQDREPALAGDGLDPVVLVLLRRFGSEVEIDRAVMVVAQVVAFAVAAGEPLAGLQFRSGLRVVDDDRPEVLGWHVAGDASGGRPWPVECVAVAVDHRPGVLRPGSNHLQRHGRRVDRRQVEEERAGIQMASAVAIVA